MPLLEVRDLVKQYRSHWTYKALQGGLRGVSFNVERGESFALLGANGAGKTTAIKCILGLIRKTSGDIIFDSIEIENKSRLGYLPEQPYFYQHLSVEETLELYAGLFGLRSHAMKSQIAYAMKTVHIEDFRKRRLKTLSKGQLQRVGIAQTLLHDPELLILDEPFSGLDPVSRVEIKNIFKDLKEKGKTLIICSHVLSEIEELCDRAIILKKGLVCKEVMLHQIYDQDPENVMFRLVLSSTDVLPHIEVNPVFQKQIMSNVIECHFRGVENSQKALREYLQKNIHVLEYAKVAQSLEQIFVEINKD